MKTKKKSKKLKVIIIIAVILLIIIGILTALISSAKSALQIPKTVTAVKLEKQDLVDSVNITGKICGEETKILNTQKTKCIKLNVKIGDYVNKGDVLFEFDKEPLKASYNKTVEMFNIERGKMETEHQINERNLEKAKSDQNALISKAQQKVNEAITARDEAYNKQNKLVEEYNNLLAKSNILGEKLQVVKDTSTDEYKEMNDSYLNMLQQCDILEKQIDVITEQLPEFEAAVTAAYDAYDEVQLSDSGTVQHAQDAIDAEKYSTYSIQQEDIDEIQKQIDGCVVKAEVSGIITELNVFEGLIPTLDSLVAIADTSNYFVEANLSENKVYKLDEGMKALIKTVATGDEELEGKIKSISNISTISQMDASNTYSIKLEINDQSKLENVLLGMSSNAEIILNTTEDVYAVPYDAVISEENDDYVYIAEPAADSSNYKIKKVRVEKGVENDYLVQISGSDIQTDAIIITSPERTSADSLVNIEFE